MLDVGKEVAAAWPGSRLRVVLVYERVSVGTDVITDGGEEPTVGRERFPGPHMRPGVARVVGSRVDGALYLVPLTSPRSIISVLGPPTKASPAGTSQDSSTTVLAGASWRRLVRRRRCGRPAGSAWLRWLRPSRFWEPPASPVTSHTSRRRGRAAKPPTTMKPFPRPHGMPSRPVFDDRLVETAYRLTTEGG